MSDSLSDRIAAAIYNDNGFGWSKYQCEEAADAVIAELGLIRDPFSTVAFCRYVTQWQPNERFAPYCNRCGIPHSTPCRRPADA
jgi:hypothetical protein